MAKRTLIAFLIILLSAVAGTSCSGGADSGTAPPVQDGDGDGVADAQDNCPVIVNPSQEDSDSNGVGDACDGVGGAGNPAGGAPGDDSAGGGGQGGDAAGGPGDEDNAGEGVGGGGGGAPPPGDADGDGVPDDRDNCPDAPNDDQADRNGDGIGDACAWVIRAR